MGGANNQHINIKLRIWRQKSANEPGKFVMIDADSVSTDASFLEMLDQVNETLIKGGEEPIVFESDCREGICGSCGFMINGDAHGPEKGTTVCQLHMRHFKNGETLTVEPFRAKSFPIIKDLMVDRAAFDRIVAAGGYVSVDTGNAQDANNIPVPKPDADESFSAATCISCGACVASCKNASAALFVGAKISHLALLPQGQVERAERAIKMLDQMEAEGFGACSTTEACSAACPKSISLTNIARLNRERLIAELTKKQAAQGDGI
jgi:succinate dehydrogenase / fumarate reductase iron-sulfur subunit